MNVYVFDKIKIYKLATLCTKNIKNEQKRVKKFKQKIAGQTISNTYILKFFILPYI